MVLAGLFLHSLDYTYIETTNLIGQLAGFYLTQNHAFQHLENQTTMHFSVGLPWQQDTWPMESALSRNPQALG